MKVTTW